MKSINIILSKIFDRSISTRAAVENLFKDVIADEVVIDFLDISFISSSAAHQMVTEIKNLEKKKVKVSSVNMDEDVFKMLELAKTDRKNIFTVPLFIKHSTIRTENDLSKFLLGST
jgi:anti-anti-sigma regulatory factor